MAHLYQISIKYAVLLFTQQRETGFSIILTNEPTSVSFSTRLNGSKSPLMTPFQTSLMSTQYLGTSASTVSISTAVAYTPSSPTVSSNSNSTLKAVLDLLLTGRLKRKQPLDEFKNIKEKGIFSHKQTYTKVGDERLYLYSAFSISSDAYIKSNISAFKAGTVKGRCDIKDIIV